MQPWVGMLRHMLERQTRIPYAERQLFPQAKVKKQRSRTAAAAHEHVLRGHAMVQPEDETFPKWQHDIFGLTTGLP